MGWRAAATVLSLAVLVLSFTRSATSIARSPLHLLGWTTVAAILAIAGIGAWQLTLTAAHAASRLFG